jgi:phospholipid/cholesterol/gamma-HCH transport system substrate-binding protein
MKNETKVGMVIIFGVLGIAAAIIALSGVRVFEKGYEVNILFNDVQGLMKQAKVQVAGVNVGYVKNITLQGEKARVTVWLANNVRINKDTSAFIFSSGIIGVKFIQLTPGTDKSGILKSGDVLVGVDPISIDKMFEKTQLAVNSLLDSVRGITSDSSIKSIINNLDQFSLDLNIISKDMKRFVSTDLKAISVDIRRITAEGRLDSILKRTDSTIASLERVSKSMENGDGAFNKLMTDKKLASDLKDTVASMKVFAKMMEDAPSGWIIDNKKAKDVKKALDQNQQKNSK